MNSNNHINRIVLISLYSIPCSNKMNELGLNGLIIFLCY
jgi:hypothetical protein